MSRTGRSANDELSALVANRIATQSADTEGDAAAELTWPCLLMRIGARWCALHAGSVRVVVSPESITRVPVQPAHVLGVSSVHGRLVPVIDLGQLMSSADMKLESAPGRRLAVITSNDIEIGLIADDAKGVIHLPALAGSHAGTEQRDFVIGEVRWQQHLVCLLDHAILVGAATGMEPA